MELEAYQNLVDDDPEGYIEVRRRLDGWFPRLEHVATSAMGASIGPHIADFTVTPQVRAPNKSWLISCLVLDSCPTRFPNAFPRSSLKHSK